MIRIFCFVIVEMQHKRVTEIIVSLGPAQSLEQLSYKLYPHSICHIQMRHLPSPSQKHEMEIVPKWTICIWCHGSFQHGTSERKMAERLIAPF